MKGHTVIVGGGLAGLAAAAALAPRGVAVTVLESRPRLGGRASSFLDKTTGAWIDNCQHVALGCCTNFRHFCETVGIADQFRTEQSLFFVARDGRLNRLSAAGLPAPLHLLPSFARLSYLAMRDLYRIATGMRALARARGADANQTTFLEWCGRQRQTRAAIDRFWTPVLVSALSESLDRIDVASARKVFVDAFLANRDGWRMSVPVVPLDDLYGSRLTGWFAKHGVAVRMQAGVERIVVEHGRAAGVELRSGETIRADDVIVAVPHYRTLDLFPQEFASQALLARIQELETAPISSVHLWFDRPILFPPGQPPAYSSAAAACLDQRPAPGARGAGDAELPHCVLVDRFSQWVFNRTALHGEAARGGLGVLSFGTPGEGQGEGSETALELADHRSSSELEIEHGHCYQVVISASRNVAALSQQETISEVLRDLADVWPASREAVLLHSRLVTEHRAVISVRPGADACRPEQQSPISNVQLAGDWTRTGWPATMEGAVRSGYLAAQNVLGRMGRPEGLVQPDLPVAFLSRLLLGLRSSR